MAPKVWTPEALEACYANIKKQIPAQEQSYGKFIKQVGKEQINKWKQIADELKIELDVDTGKIKYAKDFEPLHPQVEICYVRHGKTEGNTEPRVFQGMVDYPDNQLNEIGEEQAIEAAKKLEKMISDNEWELPDLIVSSPLQRAQHTAKPFRDNHKDMPYNLLPEVAEMKFGSWDNVKVADLPANNICHLFYLEQNALVKSKDGHRVNEDTWVHPEWLNGETKIDGENFIECMLRQKKALEKIESVAKEIVERKSVGDSRKPRVVIYGHSMAGAAVSILLGFGKTDDSGFLGFDGRYIMPNATPTLLIPERLHLK